MIVSAESDVNHSMRIWWGLGWEVSTQISGGSNKGWKYTLEALGLGVSHKSTCSRDRSTRTRAFLARGGAWKQSEAQKRR